MITAKLEKDSKKIKLSIKGHAMYNPGNDIVCSAASVLGQAAVTMVGNMKGVYSEAHMGPGNLEMTVFGDTEKIMERLAVMTTGFQMLAAAYPEYVEFDCQE